VAFSFYATKNLTTAEGGMLTGSPEFLEKARVASLHGMSRDAWKRYDKGGSWYYEVVMPGFKYNMPDIMAAMGLAQMRKLERMQDRRRAIVARYQEELADLPLILPVEREDVESAWHLFPIRLKLGELTIDRNGFIDQLASQNIGTSVHFIPIHTHPYFRNKYNWPDSDFPQAMAAYESLVTIPLNPSLSDDDVTDVVTAVRQALGRS